MSGRRLFLKQLTAGVGGALVAQDVGSVDLEAEESSYITPATPPDPDGLFFFQAHKLELNGRKHRGMVAVSFSIEVYPEPEQFSGQYGASGKRPIVQEPAAGFLTARVAGFPNASITLGEFMTVEWETFREKQRCLFRGTVRRVDIREDHTQIHVVNQHPAEGLFSVRDKEGNPYNWKSFGIS